MLKRRRFLQLGVQTLSLTAVGGVVLQACGTPTDDQPDAGSTSDTDAGTTPDAGGTTPDAGGTTPDAGDTTPDAGDTTPDAGETAACPFPTATIGTNHGHATAVAAEDIDAGVQKTFLVFGSHEHEFTLTAEHFAIIAAGGSVKVTSTALGGHSHEITVACGS